MHSVRSPESWFGCDLGEKVQQRMMKERCIATSVVPNPRPSFGRRWFQSLKSCEQIIVKQMFGVLLICGLGGLVGMLV